MLRAAGHEARSLLAEADGHWRFEVEGVDEDTALFGVLAGVFPDGPHAAGLHDGTRLSEVTLAIPRGDSSEEACLLLAAPYPVRTGAILRPADCVERSVRR